MDSFRRNVPLLAGCQALMMSCTSLLITTAALVGFTLATDKTLATLPVATLFIATMLTSIPAALLMERIGRKAGFMFATLFGMSGGAMTTLAILRGDFWLFVAGTALIGIFNGFGNYYRFTAADAVDDKHKSRAISFVMAGGVIAAFVGPNMATFTRELIETAPFAGSYASLIILYMLSFITLGFISLPSPSIHEISDSTQPARPLKIIVAQPKFIVALICGMFSYGVMSVVMTATPLAMQHHAHHFSDTSFVIQWHMLGMFAPSFVTGHLILRFGIIKILFTGAVLGLVCVAINLSGNSVTHFSMALLLLGVSWNFLFIGATTLLTESYCPAERTKTQALNDFIVFTTVAIASLSAGALQYHFGWQVVNMGAVPLLVLIFTSILWLRSQSGNTPELPVQTLQSEYKV